MKKMSMFLYFLAPAVLAAFSLAGCNKKMDQAGRKFPVVRWTADSDKMSFRYNLLQNTETFTLYTATPDSGTYSHHSHITYFKDVLIATWDNQVNDENGSGQRGLVRRSADQGRTWTPIEELFPPQDKRVPASEAFIGTRFMTSNGFAVIDDILYAVTGVAEWSGPGIDEKKRVNVGRLYRSVDPDGSLGDLFWLSETPPVPANGFPSYPAGDPELVEKINRHFKQPGNELQLDFSVSHPLSDDDHRVTEPVPSYSLRDGNWVRLYRDMGHKDAQTQKEKEETKSRRNYASFSSDNGKTWTVPARTSFPDACARSNAGKLPDGQVYVINNILPMNPGGLGGRSMLTISLSRDGLNFDRVAIIRFISPPLRYEGLEKTIGYQYPHSVVAGNDLWVMYSVNKEDVQLTRIPVAELYNLK
ncbi:MAG: exo-alpha-sialidase [Bacteroidales bacterium]|nr:exo-alpha-sialidase [Bacteroidales bacterium]